MFIIQNALLMPLSFTKDDRIAALTKDTLNNRVINRIMLYSCDEDFNMSFPFDPERSIPQFKEMTEASFFLSLTDNEGKIFLNDFNLENSILNIYEPYDKTNNQIEFFINRKLNLENSIITIKQDFYDKLTAPVIVFYQKKSLSKNFTDEIHGSITIAIPTPQPKQQPPETQFKIPLSSYLTNTLSGKLIKKIACEGYAQYRYLNGYITLRCKDGKHIENLPLDFLRIKAPKDFYFDMLDIDFEKSYVLIDTSFMNSSTPLTLTFFY